VSRPILIDDATDARLADYIGLKDADLRRRGARPGEDALGLFIAEGHLVLQRLLRSPYPLRSVLLAAERHDALAGELEGVDAPVYLASRRVMNAVAGFNIHRGVLAAADRLALPDAAALLAGARRVAVLEDVNDQENLGVLFRNAAAFGLDAVLLSPSCCDPLYRRTVRVSMGHVLGLAFATLAPWPAGLSALSDAGFLVVALTPAASAQDIRRLALDRVDRVAFLLGSEGPGLSHDALAAAAVAARIAMAPGVDSLNVAAAAAIAFWAGAPLPPAPPRPEEPPLRGAW
jgi:tRNA G18 (ribose-2'-O)-methylase SpoU